MSPVIILAQGRSGGTTLQRILNTLDNYDICGENNNIVSDLMKFYNNLELTNKKFKHTKYQEYDKNGLKPCWYNVYNKNDVKSQLKILIDTIFKLDNDNKNKIWGFKEIRMGYEKSYGEFAKLIDTFKKLFPTTKIIFNIRNDLDKQCQSSWWANNPVKARIILTTQKKFFTKYYLSHKTDCYFMSLEDMIKNNENFKGLFDFLGHDLDLKKYKKIMDDNRG
jgi:hypothetical protein